MDALSRMLPLLTSVNNAEKTTKKYADAIAKGDKITVYGKDYDSQSVTGVAIERISLMEQTLLLTILNASQIKPLEQEIRTIDGLFEHL